MKVDLRVPVGRPLPELAEVIARAEDAGFDGVGVHDHPHSGRDVYMALALAALRTRRVTLYPATSSPAVRHPLLLASAAHSLEELAPGRARLTIAPGFLAARNVGRPRSSVTAMREAIGQIRRLLAGEHEVFGPSETWMRNLAPRRTPVFLLAAGPRMTELAAEVADGVMILCGLHRDGIATARRHLAEGARRAGRSLDGFPVIFIVPLALAPSVTQASAWIRSWFAPRHSFLTYPSASNLYWLRAAGFALDDDHDPAAITEDAAARIADAFGCFGPAEHCAERLMRAREEAGVEHVFFFPAHTLDGGYDMPRAEIEAFARIMRPRLRA